MNYRHAYHAGGFTDVVKHAALVLVLRRLMEKPKPLFVLDTHAGAGRYDLLGEHAAKTGEHRAGIGRVLDWAAAPAALRPYLAIVGALNRSRVEPRWYPGSSEIIRSRLRKNDRLVAVELHPEDTRALARWMADDRRVDVRQGDGYAALKACLPPPERRGLVLIDPPFEVRDEFARIVRGLRHAWRRWPTGVYMIWYPIKDRAPVAAFHRALTDSGLSPIVAAELLLRPDDDPERLNGCGLVFVNLPWRLDGVLTDLLPALAERLGAGRGGGARVATLIGD